jgi:hypothetical protein
MYTYLYLSHALFARTTLQPRCRHNARAPAVRWRKRLISWGKWRPRAKIIAQTAGLPLPQAGIPWQAGVRLLPILLFEGSFFARPGRPLGRRLLSDS